MAERKPRATVKPLTEAQVRVIIRDELRKWKHDAAHSATQAQVTAQWERDVAAGVAIG